MSAEEKTPKRRGVSRYLAASLLMVLILLGIAIGFTRGRRSYYTDGEAIKEPVGTAPLRDVLWRPPWRLAESINSSEDTYEPRLSSDGQVLYFVRGKAGGRADIYCSQRDKDGWREPQPLDAVNSSFDDLGPEPSRDDQTLFFYSNRPGGSGGYDLWVARRNGSGWDEASNLGPGVNTEFNEYGPAASPDGTVLYFASNRPSADDGEPPSGEAWPATVREDLHPRDYDLYAASLADGRSDSVEAMVSVNTSFNEGAPAVSPPGDFVYFGSDRPGGFGGYDLYRSRRRLGHLLDPTNLGPAVNTSANELDPALGLGGFGLHFSSDRGEPAAGPDESPLYALYETVSREVFLETEYVETTIPWAALWSRLGPNLLWPLLLLLLLLDLLRLLRGTRWRRLSLLAKCILASLLAHLLLLIAMGFWEVTTTVAGLLRKGTAMQVALFVAPGDGTLVAQIRGTSTTAAVPSPMSAEPVRASVEARAGAERPVFSASLHRFELPTPADASPMLKGSQEAAIPPTDRELPEIGWGTPREAVSMSIPSVRPAEPVADRTVDQTVPAAQLSRVEPAPTLFVGSEPGAIVRPTLPDRHQHAAVASDVSLDTLDRMLAASASPTAGASLVPDVSVSSQRGAESTEIALPEVASPATADTAENPPVAPVTDVPIPKASVSHLRHRDARTDPPRPATLAPAEWPDGPDSSFTPIMVLGHTAESRLPTEPTPQMPQPAGSASALATTFEPSLPPTPLVTPTALDDNAGEPSPGVNGAAELVSADSPRPHAELQIGLDETSRPNHFALAFPKRPESREFEPSEASATGRPFQSALTDLPSGDAHTLSSLTANALPAVAMSLPSPAVRPTAPAVEISLPPDQPPAEAYRQRDPEMRPAVAKRLGGSEQTERAVGLALDWLARHQAPDGHWDGDRFDARCGKCDGQTDVPVDVALTGLSLLSFLGAGHTHTVEGPYRENVQKAVTWLSHRQGQDGDLRGDETMYSHGIATIALSEAFGMTSDTSLRDPVQRAVGFIQRALNTRQGGWRYDPGQPGDTSVLGWQVMALRSAKSGGLDVPPESLTTAGAWLDKVADPRRPGRYAYQPRRRATPAMTAEGFFVRQLLGAQRQDPGMQESADFLRQHLPNWEAQPNTYYWYYATLALFQHQGEDWREWNEAITAQLLQRQEGDRGLAGSWPPEGEWADVGGRIYQTALCTLMLEVYYRYLPLYALQTPAPERPARSDDALR